MDRYKEIHEETNKKESLFARKQIKDGDSVKKTDYQQNDAHQEEPPMAEADRKNRSKKSLPSFGIKKIRKNKSKLYGDKYRQ
ncbi:hypothetical protein P3T75_06905 [Enterococcus montenegrensis]|nr:hypothetical protein [Enterococcus montenegrensis]WHA08074.1 hypothetical protein P3T75_06905 [Enterococcus montenegrensis]